MPVYYKKIILNSKGVSLYIIVFILFLFLALASSGVYFFGPRIVRVKQTTTINTLEAAVNSIISWSQANGRIPDNSGGTTDFVNVVKNPNDAWTKPLVYIYDSNLTSTTTGGGLCGRSTTSLLDSGVYIAFAVVSGGSDYSFQTTVNGTRITVSGPQSGNLGNYQSDIYRPVSLAELKSRSGCYGSTGGRLRILNNELPRACANGGYSATVYPDGGVPDANSKYLWCIYGTLPTGVTANPSTACTSSTSSTAWSSPMLTLSLSSTPTTTGSFPVTIMLKDSDATPNVVLRNFSVNVSAAGACGPTSGGAPSGGGGSGGINIQPPSTSGTQSTDSGALSQNITSNAPGGSSAMSISGNVITFGNNLNNGAACIWYPYNFPLLGKTLRTYWNFLFAHSDTSTDSKDFADGYTFALMQGNNPATYCGTGTIYDAVQNPYYNCQYSGRLGEFLSYCGLPGQSMAVEFDIYPNNGTQSRNDPAGNYNHVAIVKSLSTHNGPPLPGTYGDNTHNFGGNPACGTIGTISACSPGGTGNPGCNGTCAGTNTCSGYCDNAAVNAYTCAGTCYGTCSGTCNGTSFLSEPACLYNTLCGNNFTIPSGHTAVTWLEDTSTHNARVEIHTRCNSTCSACEQSTCTSKSLIEVWIDKGDNNVNRDKTDVQPDVSYCIDLPPAMNQIKLGFTQGTGASYQLGQISNWTAAFDGGCPQPSITPASLPNTLLNTSYSQKVSGSGGSLSYTWSSSNLPTGLSLYTTGTCGANACSTLSPCICDTPTTVGTYNTALVSLTDSCTTDVCANTVSNNYTIIVYRYSSYSVTNVTGGSFWIKGGTYGTCTTISNNRTFTVNFTDTSPVTVFSNNTCATSQATVTFNNASSVDESGNHDGQVQLNSSWQLVERYSSYSVRNRVSSPNPFWITGGSYGSTCTQINYSGASNTFTVNVTDTSPVIVFSDNTCSTSQTTVTFQNATSVDETHNHDGRVQINSSWQLVDW